MVEGIFQAMNDAIRSFWILAAIATALLSMIVYTAWLWWSDRHKHFWYWYRNIYGDEIIESGYKRSEWHCVCGAVQFRNYLVGK